MTEAVGKEQVLSTLIVDDEPLAVERMQVICSRLDCLRIVGTAGDGAAARAPKQLFGLRLHVESGQQQV